MLTLTVSSAHEFAARVRHLRFALPVLLAVACVEDPVAMDPLTALPDIVPTNAQGVYGVIDLLAMTDAVSGSVIAVNDAGQILGRLETPAGSSRFLWENGIVYELGSLAAGRLVDPVDINEAGQVTGTAVTASNEAHAFLWQNGAMQDLGALGYEASFATDINDAGQVVGFVQSVNGTEQHAFLWQNGVMLDLGTMGGRSARALHINNASQIFGTVEPSQPDPDRRAFLWQNGANQTVVIANHMLSVLNDAGQVAFTTLENGLHSSFLWDNGGVHELGSLNGGSTFVADINDAGEIAGYAAAGPSIVHAVLWQNGVPLDIGGSAATSLAMAINESGQVAGSADGIGFIWQNGGVSRLPPLAGSDDHGVVAMNNNGWVVGNAYSQSSGVQRPVLWRLLTPVESVDQLADAVEDLVDDGTLSAGEANSLLAKLKVATGLINDGKTKAAGNVLDAFIQEVEALVRSGRLSDAQGQTLIDAALAILASIGN